jgi:DNA-binding CsgD family transcriptional regulator
VAGVKPRPLEERFWAKVEKEGHGGCWIWTGYVLPDGGGPFYSYAYKKNLRPRRYVWKTLRQDPVPHIVITSCGNDRCLNPDHLKSSKSPGQARAYELRMTGLTMQEVGDALGITRQRVEQLLSRHRFNTGQPYGKQAQVEHLREELAKCREALAAHDPRP